MLVLNLTQEKRFDDGFKLYSTMLFPNDDLMRDCYYRRLIYEVGLPEARKQNVKSISHSLEEIELLLDCPSTEETRKQVSKSIVAGRTAGNILTYIYFMKQLNIEEPSLKKAIHICSQENKKLHDSGYKNYPTSEPSIRKHWTEFNSVAHFWGAIALLDHSSYSEDVDSFLFGEALPVFLSLSEGLLKFGESFKSTRNKNATSLLNKNNMWKLPDDFKMPEMSLPINKIPTYMKEALDNYSKRYTY